MSSSTNLRDSSLQDFYPVKVFHENEYMETNDKRVLFMAQISGIEGQFLDQGELDRLHHQWRSFLQLGPDEEIQIVFRRSNSFEAFFEKKLDSFLSVKGEFSRKLFWNQFQEYIESVNDLEISEVDCVLCYSLDIQKACVAEAVEKLQAKREEILQKISSMGLEARVLKPYEVEETIVRFAQNIDYVNSSNIHEWPEVLLKGKELRIERDVFRAVQLKKLPEAYSEMGMIQALSLLPLPIEMSLRVRGKDLDPIKRKIERKRQLLFGLSSRKATGDPSAEARFQENDELLRRLNEQSDSLLEMSLVVGARSKNLLFLRKVMSEIFASGSRMQQLEWEESPFSTFDSYLECIPGFRGKIFNKHSILSSNAIHFLPFFKPTSGERENPVLSFKSPHGSLVSINPVSSSAANYNWLVSGQSGAGKSFFVNSLLGQSLSLNPQIFIVDVGGSYNKLTEFLGGKTVRLDTKEGFSIGPFFSEKQTEAQDERKRRAQVEIIFYEMLRDQGQLPQIEERALLSEVLEPLFEGDIPERPVSWVRDRLSKLGGLNAKRLSLLLKPWCYPSLFGSFVDTNQSLDLSNDIITFDLKGIKEFSELSRVIELIITASIWSSLKTRSRFSWIVLDEVAFSLLKSQPGFVHELVSTCRKMYAGTIVVVQDLESLTSSSAGSAILANTNYKAILTQRGDPKGYQEALSLSQPEIEVIRSLGRKKGEYSDIFLMDDDRRALLRYAPDPLTYLLSTTDAREVNALEEKLSHYPGSFSEKLLKVVEASKC